MRLIDLPGIYSLTSYSMEEKVSRKVILGDEVDIIVDVVDASALERNLYLTTQLMETGIPVVIALNMADLLEKRNIRIDTERLRNELDKGNIVIVAGFQGVNKYEDITTLGRGGSDTSAVALAAALHADLCQIYTDVDGVYTADPRSVKGARKLEEITFDEMLELASLGAQVLHNRSVEMAKRYNVNLEVLSSFTGNPGTKVKEVVKTMEKTHVSGVAKDKNVARLALIGLADEPGTAFKIFSLLAKKKINVDIILQSIGREETKDISFTVARGDAEEAKKILEENQEYIGFKAIEMNAQVAKVSIVGAGMVNNFGVASRMFEALSSAGININMISTSEIKVSVLVDERDADRAVQAVHDKFFSEFGGNN